MLVRHYCSSLQTVPEAAVIKRQGKNLSRLVSVRAAGVDSKGEVGGGGRGGTWVWSTAAKAGGDSSTVAPRPGRSHDVHRERRGGIEVRHLVGDVRAASMDATADTLPGCAWTTSGLLPSRP